MTKTDRAKQLERVAMHVAHKRGARYLGMIYDTHEDQCSVTFRGINGGLHVATFKPCKTDTALVKQFERIIKGKKP